MKSLQTLNHQRAQIVQRPGGLPFASIATVLLLAGILAGCGSSRTESFWTNPQNRLVAKQAYSVCSGSKYPDYPMPLQPPFSVKKDCKYVLKAWPAIQQQEAAAELQRLKTTGSVQDLYKAWEECAAYQYPFAPKAFCAQVTPIYRKKALGVIPDGASWTRQKLVQEINRCGQSQSLYGGLAAPTGGEEANYCAALHLFFDDRARSEDAAAIAAWRSKIDNYLHMSVEQFRSLTETPCGHRGTNAFGTTARMQMQFARNHPYDWSDCSAYTQALSARNRSPSSVPN